MSKIVKIRTKEYNDCLEELKQKLDDFQEQLFLSAINIATNGVWRRWDEEQESGAVFNFSEAIYHTGDKNIQEIISLKEEIDRIMQNIK